MEEEYVEQDAEDVVGSAREEEENRVFEKASEYCEETEDYPVSEPLFSCLLVIATQGLSRPLFTLKVI